jgi:hypothetical protein
LIFPQPAEEGDAFHYVLRELAHKLEERREKKSKPKPKPKRKIASKALPAGTKTGPLCVTGGYTAAPLCTLR